MGMLIYTRWRSGIRVDRGQEMTRGVHPKIATNRQHSRHPAPVYCFSGLSAGARSLTGRRPGVPDAGPPGRRAVRRAVRFFCVRRTDPQSHAPVPLSCSHFVFPLCERPITDTIYHPARDFTAIPRAAAFRARCRAQIVIVPNGPLFYFHRTGITLFSRAVWSNHALPPEQGIAAKPRKDNTQSSAWTTANPAANARIPPNVVLMLSQRRRRWPNMNTTLD